MQEGKVNVGWMLFNFCSILVQLLFSCCSVVVQLLFNCSSIVEQAQEVYRHELKLFEFQRMSEDHATIVDLME